MTPIVELDDVGTWPALFRGVVEQAAANADEDSWFADRDEGAAVDLLSPYRVRAYHCSRLTPREVHSIRSSGIRPLSHEFTRERLVNAVADGHFTEQEAAFYAQTTLASEVNRAGMVWLFTDRASLASASQISYLVEVWGGEGINMPFHSHSPEMERLKRVGTPSVVIVAIDVGVHYQHSHPGVLTAAVRTLLTNDGGTSIQSSVTIGPEYVEAIEHPSGLFWNRYVWTPRGGFTSG
jgi:hypothetical protein